MCTCLLRSYGWLGVASAWLVFEGPLDSHDPRISRLAPCTSKPQKCHHDQVDRQQRGLRAQEKEVIREEVGGREEGGLRREERAYRNKWATLRENSKSGDKSLRQQYAGRGLHCCRGDEQGIRHRRPSASALTPNSKVTVSFLAELR